MLQARERRQRRYKARRKQEAGPVPLYAPYFLSFFRPWLAVLFDLPNKRKIFPDDEGDVYLGEKMEREIGQKRTVPGIQIRGNNPTKQINECLSERRNGRIGEEEEKGRKGQGK